MPTFAYSAIDATGKRTSGEVSASDKIAALDRVAAKGLTPLEVSDPQLTGPWWSQELTFSGTRSLKPKELEAFFATFSVMLAAKTPLPQALNYCASVASSTTLKGVLRASIAAIEDGLSLASALSGNGEAFPERIITAIQLGERANNLEFVVARTAKALETEARLKEEVQQALIYPLILLSMSVLVICILVFYLAPTLSPVFETADAAAPFIINVMVGVQGVVAANWPFLLATISLLLVACIAFRRALLVPFQFLLQALPVTRRYLAKRETLKFCQTLHLILGSGGQLTEAVQIAAHAASNPRWQAMLSAALTNINAGQTITEALLKKPYFDPMIGTILATGEESDQLVTVLEFSITSLQSQTSQLLSQTVKLLTPILTITIGLIVGAIILSTISAILDLNDAVL